MTHDTDQAWEHYGQTDPYWAVITNDRYHKDQMNDRSREDFFVSGEKYIADILDKIHAHLDPRFEPASALDFGCGVGRLTLPLARRCKCVVGVDVSESMLREARAQSEARQVTNVSWIRGDDELSGVAGRFDLINSFIVLQHIPCRRGQRILKKLVSLLNEGGAGAIHLTYSRSSLDTDPCVAWPASAPAYSPTPWRDLQSYLLAVRRAARRRVRQMFGRGTNAPGTPTMQMNPYTLNPLLHILQLSGVRNMYVEFTNHGGEYGLTLFFQKPH